MFYTVENWRNRSNGWFNTNLLNRILAKEGQTGQYIGGVETGAKILNDEVIVILVGKNRPAYP